MLFEKVDLFRTVYEERGKNHAKTPPKTSEKQPSSQILQYKFRFFQKIASKITRASRIFHFLLKTVQKAHTFNQKSRLYNGKTKTR